MEDWTVAQAKARLSEVIELAMTGQPQAITRNGKPAVVVVGAAEWRRRTERKGNLAEFLAASPLHEAGLETPRMMGRLRNARLG